MISLWVLLLMIGGITGDQPIPERSYKILMLLPVSSKSHRNVFLPLANALIDRGHEIVMLSNHKKASENSRFLEIYHGLPHFDDENTNVFEYREKPIGGIFNTFQEALPLMARDLYKIPEVAELYTRRKDFDLIVIDHLFNEIMYPFAHEMPFITIATPGMDYRQCARMGNPLSPSYVPSLMNAKSMDTVFDRLSNTLMSIIFPIYWEKLAIIPLAQNEISVHFPDLPPLIDIERNQSLSLLNSHFSMDLTVPLLPSQVEVGGMTCHPPNPLPKDIASWIDGAGSAGVIYFSLGSVARSESMPVHYRSLFIEAFKKMEQRILWKFETHLDDISENVMIKDWLPQQDILGHPNVKVFISHGGHLSKQEASYHGTPLLVLPIYGDQPKNGEEIRANELGLSLIWEELTVDMIVESLREILYNSKYSENMAEVSSLMKDQLNSPLDRAVFWTEYVIRHKGAPALKSPAADLTWVEFLLLDVLSILLLMIILGLLILKWVVKKILQSVFRKNNPKRKYKGE